MLRPPVESSHYTFHDFDKYCRKHETRRSLGKTGICYDDAVSESFFTTYQKERIHTQPWPNLQTLAKETSSWVEKNDNRTRRHSTLGYLTPKEYKLG